MIHIYSSAILKMGNGPMRASSFTDTKFYSTPKIKYKIVRAKNSFLTGDLSNNTPPPPDTPVCRDFKTITYRVASKIMLRSICVCILDSLLFRRKHIFEKQCCLFLIGWVKLAAEREGRQTD